MMSDDEWRKEIDILKAMVLNLKKEVKELKKKKENER